MRTSLLLGAWLACALAAAAPGCSDACEDLAPICEQCSDQTYRASCDEVVADNVQSSCSAEMANFNTFCPPTGAGGSTNEGGTSQNTGGSAGAPGTGGTSEGGSGGTAGMGGSTGGEAGAPGAGGSAGAGGT